MAGFHTAAPGRACGTCTLCCKVYNVPDVPKVAGAWCPHCKPGRGCGVYDNRPQQCRDFLCLWMTDPVLPDGWKPERSKMVVSIFPATGFLYVQVDPAMPLAWRREPYYTQLHRWAADNLSRGVHVLVFVGEQATLIMPEQDLPLGPMKPTDSFSVRGRPGPTGIVYEAVRVTAAPAAAS